MTTLRVSVRRGGPSARPGESLIVTIGGELDVATAPRFVARFDEFLCDGLRHIVLDVSKLTFVDVTGLRALTALRAQAEQRLVAVRLSGVPAADAPADEDCRPRPGLPVKRPNDRGRR